MKCHLIFVLVFLFLNIYSQKDLIIQFNLKNKSTDTIKDYIFDTSKIEDHTNYYIGDYNKIYNTLEQTPPETHLWPGTKFTVKQKAADYYDLNSFPIRTSVKLFKIENDSFKHKCSGSIISSNHVLTAAHCVIDLHTDSLLYDSLFVSPVFNNGNYSKVFEGSMVHKIYTFSSEEYTEEEDIAVLELEKPIGNLTGWLGMGFDNNKESLKNGIFYKFSYPGRTILDLDPNSYNGDTLYFNYGIVDIVNDYTIGIMHTTGIPGESGSSIIKVKNFESYISYGVLNYSTNLNHYPIKNSIFYAIKYIIDNSHAGLGNNSKSISFDVFPNPFSDILYIKSSSGEKVKSCSLFNITGKKLIEYKELPQMINTSQFTSGLYILQIKTDKGIITKKVIKNGQ